jgi:hypothetical protein
LWLRYEIVTFFCWIASSTIFIQTVYWTKFTSVWKREAEELQILQIWNQKNTKDIAHFLKFEHDIFCVIVVDIMVHILLVF